MFAYRTPGVYFEWPDVVPPAISLRRTDIAGFVGIAAAGPLHHPVKIESWTQFVSTFGPHIPQGYLAYAVEGFFANGGQTCWVVRLADPQAAQPAKLDLLDDSGNPTLRLSAHYPGLGVPNPGTWANQLAVYVTRSSADRFGLRLALPDGRQEVWTNLTMEKSANTTGQSRHPRYVEAVLNDSASGSRLVQATDLASPAKNTLPSLKDGPWRLQGGQDGLAPSVVLLDQAGWPTLRLVTKGARPYGHTVSISATPGKAAQFSLTIDGEKFNDLTMHSDQANYVVTVLNDRRNGSKLVVAQDLQSESSHSDSIPVQVSTRLQGGLSPEHFNRKGNTTDEDWGLAALERIDAVSIVAMPDIMSAPVTERRRKQALINCAVLTEHPTLPPAPEVPLEFPPHFDTDEALVSHLQFTLVAHCERLKDRVAILDLLRSQVVADTELPAVVDWRNQFDTKYAALYYPWLRVPDPLALEGLLRTIPPCGHLAGIYARIDRFVGVHKPPANELVEGVRDVSASVDDRVHGLLNDESINVIRAFNGRGLRIAGARTLSSDIEWRYVNVRRLVSMIAEAIDEETQWIVFEPNNNRLWLDISRVTRSFLRRLWRRGMLDGEAEEEAFSVRCDRETNPPHQLDQGRVVAEIGLNLPWPAEFVIVRIGKTENGLEILD